MNRSMEAVLAQHPLLEGWLEGVKTVTGCARIVAFDAGKLLLTEGEGADTLYLVRRGTVSIEIHAPGTGPLVIDRIGPGGVVGWSWLFPPYRWHFDARAVGPVGTIAVDGVCLRNKAEKEPAFGYELMRRLSAVLLERLQATRVRLLDLYGRGAPT